MSLSTRLQAFKKFFGNEPIALAADAVTSPSAASRSAALAARRAEVEQRFAARKREIEDALGGAQEERDRLLLEADAAVEAARRAASGAIAKSLRSAGLAADVTAFAAQPTRAGAEKIRAALVEHQRLALERTGEELHALAFAAAVADILAAGRPAALEGFGNQNLWHFAVEGFASSGARLSTSSGDARAFEVALGEFERQASSIAAAASATHEGPRLVAEFAARCAWSAYRDIEAALAELRTGVEAAARAAREAEVEVNGVGNYRIL